MILTQPLNAFDMLYTDIGYDSGASMKYRNLLCLFALIAFTSCKSGVEITFVNKSAEKFKTLEVQADGKFVEFQDIESGKSTKPLRVIESYQYCYARVITEKDTVTFFPVDYMGEKLHKSGKLKMKLKIETGSDRKRYLYFVN